MRNEKIGKSVWTLEGNHGIFHINKGQKYLVVGVVEPHHTLPDGSINNDWDNHLVLQAEDGAITSKMDCYCVVCPDESIKDIDRRIDKYLSDNMVYGDVYTTTEGQIMVYISFGDWKHEHGWCDELMGYIGYGYDDAIVTEEDGSDTFSAERYYSLR